MSGVGEEVMTNDTDYPRRKKIEKNSVKNITK